MQGRKQMTTNGVFPDCGCHYTTDDDGVHFCPLHDVALELLNAAKNLLNAPEIKNCLEGRWSTADPDNYARAEKLRAAIAKAETE
jgi:Zn-finger protein